MYNESFKDLNLNFVFFQIYNRPPKTLSDRNVKTYDVYKKIILFFSLIDQLYTLVFCHVQTNAAAKESEWSANLADWIRNNDDELLKLTSKVLSTFQVIIVL